MKKTERKTEDTKSFLLVPNTVLALTHLPSLTERDETDSPTLVEFTCVDKLLYLTMSKRFEYFKKTKTPNKVGSTYYDSHKDIASLCGVSVKTVTRFIKKWKDHGYIEYVNFIGNQANYTKIVNLFPNDGAATPKQAKIEEVDDFLNRVYIDPEDDQEWRGY
jgi:hypothetical protein